MEALEKKRRSGRLLGPRRAEAGTEGIPGPAGHDLCPGRASFAGQRGQADLAPKPRSLGKSAAEGPNDRLQADLIDFSVNTRGANKYGLIVSDVFTREAVTKALPDKKTETVSAAAREIIPKVVEEETNYVVSTDQGKRHFTSKRKRLSSLLRLRKRTDNVRTTHERLSPQSKHYVHAHATYLEVQITIRTCSSIVRQFQTVDLVAHLLKLGLKFNSFSTSLWMQKKWGTNSLLNARKSRCIAFSRLDAQGPCSGKIKKETQQPR